MSELGEIVIIFEIILLVGLCQWWLVNILEELKKITSILSNKAEEAKP